MMQIISCRLFSHVEALELIIREIQGIFSMMTFDLEAEIKGQIQHLKKFAGHDFL